MFSFLCWSIMMWKLGFLLLPHVYFCPKTINIYLEIPIPILFLVL